MKHCSGHDEFRPEQERAIKAMTGKLNVLAIKYIGAGKSLIYRVPAVALDDITIVSLPVRVTLLQNKRRPS